MTKVSTRLRKQAPPRDPFVGRPYSTKSIEIPGMKRCSACKINKMDAEFYSGGRHQRGVYSKCKECCRSYSRNRPQSYFQRLYGITPAEYELMVIAQGGSCAICRGQTYRKGIRVRLSVDHNHRTGKVRGLLCHQCNVTIGYAKEQPGILRAIADYLETHSSRTEM